jgi:hypothetical protein
MAKIFDFQNKGKVGSSSYVLNDANQTLSFNTPLDGSVSLGEVSQATMRSLLPNPKKDWSNQELADLFRVHALLNKANVQVETDRGITDEGDPWFVFCHITGEVFIHMCRIDGLYLLDSPNVLRALRGKNFNELIADFTNQTLPAPGTNEEAERRVIRFERGSKISLHPSAMLAALVWTLFLASEDLVLLAPEDNTKDTAPPLSFEGMFPVAGTQDDLFTNENGGVASLPKETGPEIAHLTPETHGQTRETTQQQGLGLHQNAFATGLSTIAIAMGFVSEAVLLDNRDKVLEGLKYLELSKYYQDTQITHTQDIGDSPANSAMFALLTDFLGIDLKFGPDMVKTIKSDAAVLQQELTHVTENVVKVNENIVPVLNLHDKNIDTEFSVKLADELFKELDHFVPTKSSDSPTIETTKEVNELSLAEVIKTWQYFQSEKLDANHTLMSINVDALLNELETVAEIEIDTSDDAIQRLIDFLNDKGGDIGYIDQGNSFIAIDREAIKSGDFSYMEWQTDDGNLIGLIGLESDFLQFDMIA